MHDQLAILHDLAIPGEDDERLGREGRVVRGVPGGPRKTGRCPDLLRYHMAESGQCNPHRITAGGEFVHKKDPFPRDLNGGGGEKLRLLTHQLTPCTP